MKERWRRHLFVVLRVARPVIILAGLGAVFYLGIHSERTGFVRDVLSPGLKRFTLPVLNALRDDQARPERLDLVIPAATLDSLRAIRDRAMEAGVLDEGKDDWDTVQVVWKGDTIDARLRLKGGLTDHLSTRKWSFRIQLLDSGSVMGMRTFSLQHPNTRNFTYEWLFHRACADQGLGGLRYAFLEVHVNDKDLGTYALEQHFDQSLLDSLRLGRVPVIKFDDESRIAVLRQMNERSFDSELPIQATWQASPVDVFHSREVLADPVRAARFQKAVLQLEGFRSGALPTGRVFDIALLSRFFALCDLLGAQHATDWRNLRFVPDTVSGLLRPIGFDANAGSPIPALRVLREMGPVDGSNTRTGFFDRLYADTAFYTSYIHYVDSFSTNGFLEGLLERITPGLDRQLALIHAEFPNFQHDPAVFLHDRTVMRQTLHPRDPALAYLVSVGPVRAELALANVNALPLECTHLLVDGDTLELDGPVTLAPLDASEPLRYVRLRADMPTRSSGTIKVAFRLVGMRELHWTKVHPWTTIR